MFGKSTGVPGEFECRCGGVVKPFGYYREELVFQCNTCERQYSFEPALKRDAWLSAEECECMGMQGLAILAGMEELAE